jgi:flagellar L-ring protein precursor FlgH
MMDGMKSAQQGTWWPLAASYMTGDDRRGAVRRSDRSGYATFRVVLGVAQAFVIAACSSGPATIVSGPTSVRPVAPPAVLSANVTGSIYRGNSNAVALFSDLQKPHVVGDTIKIDISESYAASNKVISDNSRANTVHSAGPGSKQLTGPLGSIVDLSANASGSDTFAGKGDSSNAGQFAGRIEAYVVNVLPNGNLVVAGERSVAFNTGVTTMRFSGVVNPADIKAGGIVASGDVADARLELVGKGAASDAQGMTWLQKLLTGNLNIW